MRGRVLLNVKAVAAAVYFISPSLSNCATQANSDDITNERKSYFLSLCQLTIIFNSNMPTYLLLDTTVCLLWILNQFQPQRKLVKLEQTVCCCQAVEALLILS